ncbi:MAG: hypothetical protein JSS83_27715 [Cyanobacteria bacterium SZAS LIN-3]|nr:hypothetical protein [Cyanobacteria bacterium SZAS LIN-3]
MNQRIEEGLSVLLNQVGKRFVVLDRTFAHDCFVVAYRQYYRRNREGNSEKPDIAIHDFCFLVKGKMPQKKREKK